ncbi:MAG: hypothetical protein NTW59_04210, partial [Candidatus Diapherotrites archaeon]|nr:hypothetical protein [Candidatus Diapherotrites archaeon]
PEDFARGADYRPNLVINDGPVVYITKPSLLKLNGPNYINRGPHAPVELWPTAKIKELLAKKK